MDPARRDVHGRAPPPLRRRPRRSSLDGRRPPRAQHAVDFCERASYWSPEGAPTPALPRKREREPPHSEQHGQQNRCGPHHRHCWISNLPTDAEAPLSRLRGRVGVEVPPHTYSWVRLAWKSRSNRECIMEHAPHDLTSRERYKVPTNSSCRGDRLDD